MERHATSVSSSCLSYDDSSIGMTTSYLRKHLSGPGKLGCVQIVFYEKM